MLSVLTRFIQPYPNQKPVNFLMLSLRKIDTLTPVHETHFIKINVMHVLSLIYQEIIS